MKAMKNTITPEYLKKYCSEKFSKSWTIKECEQAIYHAEMRGANTPYSVRQEAINCLYY